MRTGPSDHDARAAEERPRLYGWSVAASMGTLWGVVGYTVLWEGTPFAVDRPFVRSVVGTLALLPVRAVLWAIGGLESHAGRSFDLSANHGWIALAAAAVGAAVALGAFLAARSIVRRAR